MARTDRMELMNSGNISKSLVKLGLPMVMSMLVTALYNVVDTYFVSGLGTLQVAAVSVAFPISLIFSGIGLTFGIGGGSYISRLLGAKNKEKAEEIATTSLFSGLIMGLIIAVFFFVFLTPTLKFMGATSNILPYAKDYGIIFIISTLFSVGNILSGNLAVCQGASNITLTAMISGSLLNMALDPLLINVLNLGVRGAAVATLISQIITCFIYVWFFGGGKSYLKIHISDFSLNFATYKEIIKIGISMLLLQLLSSLSMSLISKSASLYSDEAVAAIGIVLRIVTLGVNIVFGFMKGFQPMAGFNYGSKNYIRLKQAIKSAMLWTTAFCVIWSIVTIVFAKPILGIFSTDAVVLKIAYHAFIANTIMFFTFGFQFTYSTLYLSIGKAVSGCILNISRQGLFFIPVIIILPMIFGLNGVIYAQATADIITSVVTIFFAIKIHKELNVLINQ